jgi:uncharacterized protein (TIGR01777 family)
MKVVIPGGTGRVGTMLAEKYLARGWEVVMLSRCVREAPWRVVEWDGKSMGPWVAELDGADVLINMAGRTVNCRYTAENRRQIMDSRLDSTRVLGEALASVEDPPKLWLQASTATIYAHRYDAGNDEDTGILGGDEQGAPDTWNFSIDVSQSWERVANEVAPDGIRLVLLRSAMTMDPAKGGVFDTLSGLAKVGLGGTAGHGRQFISWIHGADFVRALDWLIEDEDISGPVNISSPNPLANAEFMRILRRRWSVPFGLPTSNWMVELGAVFLRTESELVLKSRYVIPGRLQEAGFEFEYPDWDDAAAELVARSRGQRGVSK